MPESFESPNLGALAAVIAPLQERIRTAMEHRGGLLSGEVAVEETYIGGKEHNRYKARRKRLERGPVGKQPVLGMRSRGSSKVRAKPIDAPDHFIVHSAIVEKVKRGGMVCTGVRRAYEGLPGYPHEAVKHSEGEYVRGRARTISGILGRRLTYEELTR